MKTTTLFTMLIAFVLCCIACVGQEEQVGDVMNDARDIQKQIDTAKEGATIVVKKGSYVGTLRIVGKKKLAIDFAESKLITQKDETIFIIENSSDIKIKGLTIYHELDHQVGCFNNCFDVNHCKNVSFDKCDINGSGFIGVCINQSDVVIENSIIHKCQTGVFIWNNNEDIFDEQEGKVTTFEDCEVTIKDTQFAENKHHNVTVYGNYVRKALAVVSINGVTFALNKDNCEEYIAKSDGMNECILD